MIKTIYDVIKDIFKTASDVDLEDMSFDELKEYALKQNVFHTWSYQNAEGYGIGTDDPNVETIHGYCDDGENEYSEVIFRKDGTAHIVAPNEVFIWNQQLYEKGEPSIS